MFITAKQHFQYVTGVYKKVLRSELLRGCARREKNKNKNGDLSRLKDFLPHLNKSSYGCVLLILQNLPSVFTQHLCELYVFTYCVPNKSMHLYCQLYGISFQAFGGPHISFNISFHTRKDTYCMSNPGRKDAFTASSGSMIGVTACHDEITWRGSG